MKKREKKGVNDPVRDSFDRQMKNKRDTEKENLHLVLYCVILLWFVCVCVCVFCCCFLTLLHGLRCCKRLHAVTRLNTLAQKKEGGGEGKKRTHTHTRKRGRQKDTQRDKTTPAALCAGGGGSQGTEQQRPEPPSEKRDNSASSQANRPPQPGPREGVPLFNHYTTPLPPPLAHRPSLASHKMAAARILLLGERGAGESMLMLTGLLSIPHSFCFYLRFLSTAVFLPFKYWEGTFPQLPDVAGTSLS
ncbi:uncharacterized protein LOC127578633 [Pristis pectinata]|uniref:uncharacterized protein LOC127578633 n=1 Tax=Pristis pectinata TaxID=685728 RepID=UPI00223E68A5|nr:uncharacterized protein LOC127578633 [Pristis pectinata]